MALVAREHNGIRYWSTLQNKGAAKVATGYPAGALDGYDFARCALCKMHIKRSEGWVCARKIATPDRTPENHSGDPPPEPCI